MKVNHIGLDLELICFREERLRFWSDPDTELKLAKDTGVTVYRMGIDWTRIIPKEPVNGVREIVSLKMTLLSLFFCPLLMYNECNYSMHVSPRHFSQM